MSGSKLQAVLDDFVSAVVGVAEDTAQNTLRARAKALRTITHSNRKPMAATPSVTKRKSMTKPCPVLSCENTGAPRHGMMCADHGNLPKKKKAALRFEAKEPGGKWNPSPAVKKQAVKKSPKKKPAKTNKPSARKRAKAKAK